MKLLRSAIYVFLFLSPAFAKVHIIGLSGPQHVKLITGENDDHSLDIIVRTLLIDGRAREFTTGDAHDVTDRLFVVRRAYRVNDTLPSDGKKKSWTWQRGGWLLIDRFTGGVKQLALPEYDAYYSTASWFRDYVAYCGVSDNGDHLYAIVVQLGRRKPVLKKAIGAPLADASPDSECASPVWERKPTRITFAPRNAKDTLSFTVAIRGRAAEIQTIESEAADADD